MKTAFLTFFILLHSIFLFAQSIQSNDDSEWWKRNNLRTIQVNLPAYEAATLNPDSLLEDLKACSANTLIINAGGIMAFFPSKLDFHYINPYMKPNMLGDVVRKCHQNGIRVMVRFDFSRVHETIFKAHPDWCYISPKGERMINTDKYVVSINAPYVQDRAFKIIEEVIDTFDIDGIFLNMPGYQVRNPYENQYHGIDQNEFDKKAFAEFSNGMTLPTVENKADSIFRKYEEFKKHTTEKWSEKLYHSVKSKRKKIAICTYMDKFVDIIRHESQTNGLPYWPYGASDNVNNAATSYPEHIISNASIQQISFQSRYNAVEPEEVEIRLYENIANGSGLDMSMMGDMRGYEDERSYGVFKEVYGFHKKHEKYFGKYKSTAKIVVIAPGSWPSGSPMQEYRGIQLMLKEAHLQYDIIEDAQIANLKESLKKYRLIILPDITYLKPDAVKALEDAAAQGTNLIATNQSFFDNPAFLKKVFGAKIIQKEYEGSGNYLKIDDRQIFRRLDKQTMISWKFNLGMYDFSEADETYLPILAKGRPGPPELIGGHDPVGNSAMAVKKMGSSKNVILPINIGKLYYLHGYEQYKNIILDVIQYIDSQLFNDLQTNAHPRVEVILQEYTANDGIAKNTADGKILHLINLTGFSGNTYFSPLPINDISFRIACEFSPKKVFSMKDNQPIRFSWKNGFLEFNVKKLNSYQGIVIDKQ